MDPPTRGQPLYMYNFIFLLFITKDTGYGTDWNSYSACYKELNLPPEDNLWMKDKSPHSQSVLYSEAPL